MIGKTNANVITNVISAQGDFLVRFWDVDGTLLKEEWVNEGENATPPITPTYYSPHSVFFGWNQSYENIQYPADIGALYTTEFTIHEIEINDFSGFQPSVRVSKRDSSQLIVEWDDGETSTSTATGTVTLIKPNPYATSGRYKIILKSGQNTLDTVTNTCLFTNTNCDRNVYKIFIGNNINQTNVNFINSNYHKKLKILCYNPQKSPTLQNVIFTGLQNLLSAIYPNQVFTGSSYAQSLYKAKVICLPNNGSIISSVGSQCYTIERMIYPPLNTYTTTNNVTGCYKLKYLYMYNTTTLLNNLLNSTNSLIKVENWPQNITVIQSSAVSTTSAEIEVLDLSNCTDFSAAAFVGQNSYNVKKIILPTNPNSNTFPINFMRESWFESITLPDNTVSVGNFGFYLFRGRKIDCKTCTTFGNSCFYQMQTIETIIFRSLTVPTFGTSCFSNFPIDGKIYVPDASLALYKADAQLSVYSTQILPLSQYID